MEDLKQRLNELVLKASKVTAFGVPVLGNVSEVHKQLRSKIESYRNAFSEKDDSCFLFDCNERAIKSHTLSESRVLNQLIDDNNERLYYLEDLPRLYSDMSTLKKKEKKLLDKTIGEISTFYGFCGEHDRNLFKILDNQTYSNTEEVNFLHTVRVLARELTLDRNLQYSLLSEFEGFHEYFSELDNLLDEIVNRCSNEFIIQFEKIPTIPYVKQLKVSLEFFVYSVFQKRKSDLGKESVDNLYIELLEKDAYPKSIEQFKLDFEIGTRRLLLKYINCNKSDLDEARLFSENAINSKDELRELERTIENIADRIKRKDYSFYDYLHLPIEGIFKIAGGFSYPRPRASRSSRCLEGP